MSKNNDRRWLAEIDIFMRDFNDFDEIWDSFDPKDVLVSIRNENSSHFEFF